jgi:hypothetical protein
LGIYLGCFWPSLAIRSCYFGHYRHGRGVSGVCGVSGRGHYQGKAMSKYQVTIERDGRPIIFPPYDSWALAAATAAELASIVAEGCIVRFIANEQAVQAGGDYAEFMQACERVAQ